MITKNQVKYIHSLGVKKYRDEERCFVAEGPKVITDLLPLLSCKTLFLTPSFKEKLSLQMLSKVQNIVEITQSELERMSLQRAPREALALFNYKDEDDTQQNLKAIPQNSLCLALDGVQDPGNLGTILRIADWFGIEHIFASHETADVYSPKVVQATMGAIGRVHIHYLDLALFLSTIKEQTPIWGTFLDGKNLYSAHLENKGVIVMGNEGNGISCEVSKLINNRLLIPNYPAGRMTSESLNVAVATAIVCGEFRRHCL